MAIDAETEADLRERIATAVAEGFSSRDDLIGSFTEDVEQETGENDLEPLVTPLVDAALAAHHREQARWTGRTDCDRLDEAFAALEAGGIIARQHYSCCSNCGHAELAGQLAAAIEEGQPVSGYAFYHVQDTERAVAGGGVYVKYDAQADDPVAKAAVGRQVVAAIEQAGLKAEWNGDPETSVLVHLDWRKWRPADELANG